MLVQCRGHVLVPALGMVFVARGQETPGGGQYLREENLTPPYRILPPRAVNSARRASMTNWTTSGASSGCITASVRFVQTDSDAFRKPFILSLSFSDAREGGLLVK